MLLMAEMIFHLTFEHGLKNGAKNLLQDVLYVFRALDVVVVEDLLSNLLVWGSWWSFTLCHSVTVLIFVYPSMGHKVDSCNTDLHKLFYTPKRNEFYGEPKTLEQVGQILNVTRERVRQIEIKAIKKLRIKLRERGYNENGNSTSIGGFGRQSSTDIKDETVLYRLGDDLIHATGSVFDKGSSFIKVRNLQAMKLFHCQ